MKMEAVSKDEQLLDSEVPPHVTQEKADSQAEEGALDLQAPSLKDGGEDVADSSGLASMPCLLMELRRDSSESQLASTESDKPTAGRVYESDSSNHCMLSPSSSGHLADSDTLSSAEETESRRPEAISEGCDAASQGATVARKSRRSRSESETSTMAAKKNRQSSDKQNGRVTKIKGHRSQKHKERIRLLRQKREAAARKKYNLLQDSSTSDSDLTCDSSTSSSDEDEEVSGSSKTITAEIPEMQRQTEEKFRMWIEKLTRLDTDEESKQQLEPGETKLHLGGQSFTPSSSSSTFVAGPESPTFPQQALGSYVSYQNVDTLEFPPSNALNNNNFPESFPENGNNITDQEINQS
ncbi:hypothetical protein GDO81_019273 [Engystomops pustulosus]|uniref:E3 ubiquitin-protein ligase Arkadia N-terminal domain-containing protein n=1 Tax=Engystomops pustulosus TaxID=76066 RepID=A0AAV6ZA16_ENGPU|nr:hypothetical protein GDO81_019273 [Engystomops pustulosus]